MSGMQIILGTIQRAVMDTVHLVGQGGGWGGEREKAGIKICDMEYEKVSFYMDLEETLEMAVLIILLKKAVMLVMEYESNAEMRKLPNDASGLTAFSANI
ncbi:hypothetical protein T06_11098 [Trichinella sp. T6]|nr:hypothetical protein T06_11098 [Trichinella sp. T6]